MPQTLAGFKKAFFSVQSVADPMERARLAALSKFGAFVRTRAKSSIRKRKAVSAPGSPPSSHAGQLKKLLLFAYDDASRSVVVGPAAYKAAEAPSLLERGGTDRRGRRYKARPFMRPAMEAELPKFAGLFRDSFKG